MEKVEFNFFAWFVQNLSLLNLLSLRVDGLNQFGGFVVANHGLKA
jgi:hypothetical protein